MQPSPVNMEAPAVPTWGAMCVSVQWVILVTVVRTMWTSVPPSPASMEVPVLTLWPAISVPVLLGHWEYSVRSTRMTVAHPWTQASGVYTTAPVWIWWVVSAVTAPRDTQVCIARRISTSVAQVSAMRHTPGTACKIQAGTFVVSVILASQVPAVKPPCLLVSPSHANMAGSAVLAQAPEVG